MDELGLVIEEYKSVRQESLEALGRQQTIAQYGLAATGVGVGIGLVAGDNHQTTLAAIVLMGLMPLLALFGAMMSATEAQRVARAGWYLRGLEARINKRLPADFEPLGWETMLGNNTAYRVQGYVAVLGIVIAITAVISVGLGGYLLASKGHWGWLAGAVVADAAVLAVIALWSHRIWTRLKWFGSADPDAHPFATASG